MSRARPAPGTTVRRGTGRRHWVPTAVAGSGPNVIKALSTVPAAHEFRTRLLEAHYLPTDALLGDLDWSRGTLDRRPPSAG